MNDKINAVMRMAMAIIGVGFLYLFLVTFAPIPITGTDHAKTIVGFIMGTVISIPIGYYWGSSSKSKPSPETIPQIEEATKIDVAKITAAQEVEAAKTEGEKTV